MEKKHALEDGHWKPERRLKGDLNYTATSRGGRPFAGREALASRYANIVSCWASIERGFLETYSYMAEEDEWASAEELERKGLKKIISKFLSLAEERFGLEVKNQIGELVEPMWDLATERHRMVHSVFIRGQREGDLLESEIACFQKYGKETEYYIYSLEQLSLMEEVFEWYWQTFRQLQLFVMANSNPKYASGATLLPYNIQVKGKVPLDRIKD